MTSRMATTHRVPFWIPIMNPLKATKLIQTHVRSGSRSNGTIWSSSLSADGRFRIADA